MVIFITQINKLIRQKSIKVVFYDRFAMHDSFTAPVIDRFLELQGRAFYFVAVKDHPALEKKRRKCEVFYVERELELLFRYLRVAMLVTPTTAYDPDAKNRHTKVAHIYHSPVSMHYIYGDNSFDSYDIFFAVGPHHTREFELLSELRGWIGKVSYPAGYPKIDNITRHYQTIRDTELTRVKTKIAFAPSWGKKNILRSHGQAIIADLLKEGFEVVLRPHKHNFDFDREVIDKIVNSFNDQDFTLDRELGFDKIYTCDVLVSDWSGIAYEFAFATCKPVVSVEVKGAQKIQTIINLTIDLEPMEDVCRFDIGVVTLPATVSQRVVDIINQGQEQWLSGISAARDKYLYNFGSSADVIAHKLIELTIHDQDNNKH